MSDVLESIEMKIEDYESAEADGVSLNGCISIPIETLKELIQRIKLLQSEVEKSKFRSAKGERQIMDDWGAEYAAALDKAWKYIKSDGSFTTNELREWTNSMDSDMCRRLLVGLIFTTWDKVGDKSS